MLWQLPRAHHLPQAGPGDLAFLTRSFRLQFQLQTRLSCHRNMERPARYECAHSSVDTFSTSYHVDTEEKFSTAAPHTVRVRTTISAAFDQLDKS